jgi:hypothetical protein
LSFVLGAALALYFGLSDLDGLDEIFSLDDLGVRPSLLWSQLVKIFYEGEILLRYYIPIPLILLILFIILIQHIYSISCLIFLNFKKIKNYIFNFILIVNEFLEDINDLI